MIRYLQLALILLAFGVTATVNAQPVPKSLPVTNRTETDVTPLSINSLEDDFAAAVVRGGEQLVFTSARPGMFGGAGTQRLWLALRTSPGWSAPTTTSEALSHGEHVGTATLTPDGNFMIFSAFDWSESEQRGSGRTDLYAAELVRGEWSNIRNLGPVVNSEYWDSQPALSPDGRTLYFASDRPGGEGGVDLYVSRLSATGWSAPVNLGPSVNTPFDEMAPSIAPDMKSLFFFERWIWWRRRLRSFHCQGRHSARPWMGKHRERRHADQLGLQRVLFRLASQLEEQLLQLRPRRELRHLPCLSEPISGRRPCDGSRQDSRCNDEAPDRRGYLGDRSHKWRGSGILSYR